MIIRKDEDHVAGLRTRDLLWDNRGGHGRYSRSDGVTDDEIPKYPKNDE